MIQQRLEPRTVKPWQGDPPTLLPVLNYVAELLDGTYSIHQQATLKIVSLGTGTDHLGVGVRLTVGAASGYGFVFDSLGNWRLSRLTTGVGADLATGSTTLNVNDVLTLSVLGTTLTAKLNAGTLATVVDATYDTGVPGVLASGSVGPADPLVGDDFTADEITVTTPHYCEWVDGTFDDDQQATLKVVGQIGRAHV